MSRARERNRFAIDGLLVGEGLYHVGDRIQNSEARSQKRSARVPPLGFDLPRRTCTFWILTSGF
jgi:hypothetical protein